MKSSSNPFLHVAVLTTASSAMLIQLASATDYLWGGGNLDWTDTSAAGWNGGPPSGGDNATINSGTVTLTSNNLVNPLASVTIGGTGKISQTTGNTWSAFFNLKLSGGTLDSVRPGGGGTFGASQLSNTVTVTGGSASTISTSGTGSVFINLGLAVNDSATFTTFDVGNVTSDPATDLTVSTVLGNNIATNFSSFSAAGLIKTGAGAMTLSANNTYTGETTVNQGVLEIAGSSAGNSYIRGTATVNSGAELRYTGGDGTGFGFNGGNKIDILNINGGLVDSQNTAHLYGATLNMTGGELRLNGGTSDPAGYRIEWNNSTVNTSASASTATISGRINLRGDDGYTSAVFNVEDGAATTDLLVSAAITQSSSVGITKNGAGTMELSGTNSYTGTTTVNEGIMKVDTASFSDFSTVEIAFGAKIDLNFAGSNVVGRLIIDGETMSGGTYNATTHPDYFTGSGSLLVLNQDGIWTSNTSGNWSASANWQANVIATGANKTATFNPGAPVTVTVDSSRFIGALAFTGFATTLAGSNILTLDNTSFTQPQVSVASGLAATIETDIGGTLGLEKTGPGTLVFTGTKSYTGGTTVTGGTLELQGANSGNAQIHDSVTINPGATLTLTGGDGTGFGFFNSPVNNITIDAGTLNASSSHIGFGGSANVFLSNGGSITGAWQWNGPVNFTSAGDTTNTISGQLNLRADSGLDHAFYVEDGAAATDLLISANTADRFGPLFLWERSSLTKNGDGSMVLSGVHTHSGNTTINAGLLELAAGSQLKFSIEDAATNQVTGTGTAIFSGIFNIDTSAVTVGPGATWQLVDVAGLTESFTASFSVADFTAQPDGHTWTKPVGANKYSFDENTGALSLLVAANDYDTWKSANGVTGGENDDDDADGLTNHEEYAFGLDPTGGSSVNPITVQLNKGTGQFTYQRRTQSFTGLTYTVWSSTDLVTWAPATFSESVTGQVADVETVQVTLTPAPTAPKFFVQVRAQ